MCLLGPLSGREWISLRKSFLVPIRIGRDDPAGLIQALNLIGRQRPANGSEIFRQLRFVARADDEARDRGTLKEPIERDLSHRFPCLAGDLIDRLDDGEEMPVLHERTVSGPQAAPAALRHGYAPPDLAGTRLASE